MAGAPTDPAEAVRTRAERLLSVDYFVMLGVSPTASAQEVQSAFIGAVKEWHPDRCPAALASLKPLYAQVFSRLEEARATLSDPGKRLAYAGGKRTTERTSERNVPVAGGGGMSEAGLEYKKAETFLKRGDLEQAEGHAKRAAGLDPKRGEYRAAVIWIEANKPRLTVERTRELLAELDGILAKEPECERALHYRGTIRKRMDMIPQAMADFERAATLDPKNLDAAREVRLYRMRAGELPKDKKKGADDDEGGVGGFFKKLFKR